MLLRDVYCVNMLLFYFTEERLKVLVGNTDSTIIRKVLTVSMIDI